MRLQFLNSLPLDVISGGNLYNKAIIEGLSQNGFHVDYSNSPQDKAYDISVIDSLCMATINLNALKNSKQIIALIHQIPELDDESLHFYKAHAKFIVTGEPSKLELMNQWQLHEKNIRIIRPGIPDSWTPKTEFKRVPKRILIVANFIRNKGYKMLVKIIKRLNHLDLEFHIVGNDSLDISFAKEIIKSLKSISNKVNLHFNLNRDKVYNQFVKSDIFLNLSKSETFGMSLFEALSLNIPSIAYNAGDSNYFSSFPNYVMVNDYSEDCFIKIITQWVNNPSIYKQYCHLHFKNKRNWNHVNIEFSAYLKNNLIVC